MLHLTLKTFHVTCFTAVGAIEQSCIKASGGLTASPRPCPAALRVSGTAGRRCPWEALAEHSWARCSQDLATKASYDLMNTEYRNISEAFFACILQQGIKQWKGSHVLPCSVTEADACFGSRNISLKHGPEAQCPCGRRYQASYVFSLTVHVTCAVLHSTQPSGE